MEILLSIKNNDYNILNFSAKWCKSCQDFDKTTFKKLKEKYTYCKKIDIDKNEVLTNQFKIETVPTILILKKNKVIEHFSTSNDLSFDIISSKVDTIINSSKKDMNDVVKNNIVSITH